MRMESLKMLTLKAWVSCCL